jgi:hypothetical protein
MQSDTELIDHQEQTIKDFNNYYYTNPIYITSNMNKLFFVIKIKY